MRRVILLALLALALPTAALANSISSTNSTETLMYVCAPSIAPCVVGTNHTPPFRNFETPFHLTLAGPSGMAEIMIAGVQLSPNPCGPTTTGVHTCTFTGGEVRILEAGEVKEAFPIVTGGFTIDADARSITGFHATLGPNGSVTFLQPFTWNGSGKVTTDGSINVVEPTPVPEPGTLEGLLLGAGVIGLIGLAGMARHKLKLGNPNLAAC